MMRKGTRLSGKANASELSINSVNVNKPKMLTGLNQKVSGWIARLRLELQGQNATGRETEPNPFMGYLGGTR